MMTETGEGRTYRLRQCLPTALSPKRLVGFYQIEPPAAVADCELQATSSLPLAKWW